MGKEENEMQIDKSIKAKLLKYLFGLALMMLVFGATSITAYAYHCAGQVDCGCPFNCTGATCWYNSRSDSCKGHNFVDDSGYSQVLWSTDPCCDHAGSKKVRYYSPFHCTRCPISDNPYEDKSEYNGGPYGHQLTGWQDYNDSYHVIKCTASWHSGCDGSTIRSQEAHNSNGAEYQRNDWYGYTFMGWGVSRNWCTSRYASNSATNESQGIKQAYDYTTASKDKRLAQEWATIGGKDLAAGDQTITLYAQWERIISYKFFYYKEGNTNNYDCNTSTVAFHNDDNEYLYMDIYMKRCCEAAFSVQKDADSGFFCAKN